MTKNHVPLGEDRPPVKTIVVVEDDRDIGEFFVEALKQEMPYQVALATDGFQALKMVRSLKPNLFVLDYLLPSMNGLELYEHLQAMETFKDIPMLFMSANMPTGTLGKLHTHFIRKPFDLEELLQIIGKLLAY